MKLQLVRLRDSLSDSFWFLPALMALLAAGIALGTVSLDHAIGSRWVQDIAWVWSGGPDGARSVLSVIAGSIMTVVSIVFSLTISVLAQTSSHFGPRVLRNFTSDRGVQFTLGTFIATFVYCLLVLRTVRSVEEAAFVPYLAVNLGVALAIGSLAVLIFFIHHVSQSIQAENLIARVGRDFLDSLDVLFPERIGESTDYQEPDEKFWQHAQSVDSTVNGYIQRVDDEQLMHLAVRHDVQLKLEKRPGEFVSHNAPLLRVGPPSHINDRLKRQLRACFGMGQHRTPHQDVLFSMQQLVEIAAHALSPGINEPFTALTCIDWLGAALRGAVGRPTPSPLRYDKQEKLRVVTRVVTFDELARASFEQIRIYGASSPDILLGLLQLISDLAPDVERDADREVLAHHAHLIGEDASQIANQDDQERVMQRLQKALHALRTGGHIRDDQ